MRALCVLAGLVLWVAACSSVMRTLIVPRGSSGLNRFKNKALLIGFRGGRPAHVDLRAA